MGRAVVVQQAVTRRLIAVLIIFIAILLYIIGATAKPSRPVPAPLPIAPFCKDPYGAFNQRMWDYCDLVDRYYEI
jgi:ABC-type transporter lipoprotein component MlaA